MVFVVGFYGGGVGVYIKLLVNHGKWVLEYCFLDANQIR